MITAIKQTLWILLLTFAEADVSQSGLSATKTCKKDKSKDKASLIAGSIHID